ncbi:MAG: hypothetical protein ACC628_02265 [Pirellulaceae bacterium]
MKRPLALRDRPLHLAAWVLPLTVWWAVSVVEASEEQPPSLAVVQHLVNSHFSARRDFQKGDLISKRDVLPIFTELQGLGWKVADQAEILSLVLDDGSAVVQTTRTRNGKKFMRKVSGYRLIYDRLDRITREPGGRRLLADLVKLPDAERYAKMKSRRGALNMLDFLPKNRSGKRRRIADYEKPTGRIYTIDAFLKRLQQSHSKALRESTGR